MKRSLWMLALLIAFSQMPLAAQQAPPELKTTLDQAVKAIDGGDQTALQAVSAGDPKTLYRWAFRPSISGSASFGGRGSRWKADPIHIPNDPTDSWQAVFWEVHPCESMGDHVHKLVHDAGGWKIGDEIPETETFGFRIRSHDISVELDPPKHEARFVNNVLFERLRTDAHPFQMRISVDFTVDSITANGAAVPFNQVGGVLYAVPPDGKQFTLTMRYHGSPHHSDLFVGNFVDTSEVALSAYWYPVIARLPTTNTVTVTVPKGWTAMSQGNLMFHSDRADTSVFTYHMDVPNCYFTLDAGPYYVYQKMVRGRTYAVYLLKPENDRAEKQLDLMDSSFQLFEKLWGPYPFDHYTIVETQQPGWAGALESYSFTTYGRGLMPSDNPHEWGHNWWGGFVPCTYLQDIWNESFADYSESVFARHGGDSPAPQAVRDSLNWKRPFPEMDRLTQSLPLSESADALYGPSSIVGYSKGGLVMQNLEETLGFDMLMKCMHAFRDAYYLSGEAATWSDFERVVNKTTGKNYKWWFDQWVRRKGLPSLKWENVTMKRNGGHYDVQADLVQVGEPYRLEVPIWLTTETEETAKVVREIHTARTHIHMSSTAPPKRLILDPEIRLPRAITNQEGGASSDSGDVKSFIVAGPSDKATATRIAGFGAGTLKSDTEVTDEDLKDANLILIGNADSNKLWARWAKSCPFQATAAGITYNGKTYHGASANGRSENPLNAARRVFWISGDSIDFGNSGNSLENLEVRDAAGRLLDAQVGILEAGPSVYQFKAGGK